MKLFKNILFGAIIILSSVTISAQELTLPTDSKPEGLDFVQRTLVLQYTGTTCPHCHNMIRAIEQLLEDDTYNNKFHLAVCHNYNGDDPLYLDPDNVREIYPLGEHPRVIVGFTEKVTSANTTVSVNNLKSAIDNSLARKVRAGIAVNSALNENTLTVKAELKSAKEEEFSLGCWLLEDGVSAPQSNMGSITHNDGIRFAEKPYGNELGTIDVGGTATTTFTITLEEGWKKENCHLILFACYKTSGRWVITNTIVAPLNTAVPYEYLTPGAIDEVNANDKLQVAYLPGEQMEVVAPTLMKELAVYNMQGQLMVQLKPESETALLSLSDLPTGVYTLRANLDNKIITEKIIKY